MYLYMYVCILIEVNSILSVKTSDIAENSATLNAVLPCSSPDLKLFLSNVTLNNMKVTVKNISDTTDADNESVYSHPNHAILLKDLKSDTTYNYCVIAINATNATNVTYTTNATNMMQVGKPMCGNFTTSKNIEGN